MLLSEPSSRNAVPRLDPRWFVTECPLDPDRAAEAIRVRHGYASRTVALRALRKARDVLRAEKHPDAEALADLEPAEQRRGRTKRAR